MKFCPDFGDHYSQHLKQEDYDTERTMYLEHRGYKVLRFWNNVVLNDMDLVIQTILDALDEPGPD